jgi:hypothetical protein
VRTRETRRGRAGARTETTVLYGGDEPAVDTLRVTRPRGAFARAACLGLVGAMLLGLFAFPTSAGQDPYHLHLVIGGTPASRALALVSHLRRERERIDDMEPLTVPTAAGARGGPDVRVFSLRGNDDSGSAVLSLESGGAALQATSPTIAVPSQTAWSLACPPVGVPQTALATPDPPPRRV